MQTYVEDSTVRHLISKSVHDHQVVARDRMQVEQLAKLLPAMASKGYDVASRKHSLRAKQAMFDECCSSARAPQSVDLGEFSQWTGPAVPSIPQYVAVPSIPRASREQQQQQPLIEQEQMEQMELEQMEQKLEQELEQMDQMIG